MPNSGSGFGFKFSYYKPLLFFNNLSFEYITYLTTTLDWVSIGSNLFFKGNYFDFNVGRENIDDYGFNYFWSIGSCISAAKNTNVVYFPSLKIGVNYNFINNRGK